MPTPVSTARQCLTPEAAHALDEAVSVARRRGHSQTTSLHAVSALLSLPSSILHDACARARNSAYSPRLQFKALELCLSVSLDRVPSGQLNEDPPVSNSLMAAIKRSQANQRRQPESFHLYHQISQQQSAASMSCIKVELQNLILSILDDPVVSRVFGEAGFPSSEIKRAIIRPLPQVFKFSRFKGPPMFLCNLGDNSDLGSGRRRFSFPFPGFTGSFNGDENCRRIGEVLTRNKGRNPLLVGVYAYDTLASFSEVIEKRKDNFLPLDLAGIGVVCIESDIKKFQSENFDNGCADLKFEEVSRLIEQNLGTGLVINLGDLKAFGSGDNGELSDSMSYVVEKLTKLLQMYGKKVWLIGSTSSYEGYLKFVSKFPSIEKDWDLQLLPVTSFRTSMAESYPRSSLMESFVPFGGCFSTLSEVNSSLGSSYQLISRCHLCNEKCEQEILAVSKGGFVSSVADQYQSNLPSWLQMNELGTNKELDMKIRDDGVVLSAKVAGVQKKWDNICRRLHHAQLPGSNIHPARFPTVVDFQLLQDRKEDAEKCSSNNATASPFRSRCTDHPIDLQKISSKQLGVPSSVVSEENTKKPLKENHLMSDGLKSSHSFSNSSLADGNQESPTTVTSMTTALGLTLSPAPTCKDTKKVACKKQQDLSGSFSESVAVINGSISENLAQPSSSSSIDFKGRFDSGSFKALFQALIKKVSWQDEAVHLISRTLAQYHTRKEGRHGASLRRDIWFHFLGPDRHGKKKVAAALAEIIYGGKGNFISADLGSQYWMMRTQARDVHSYSVMFRGKTVIDYVASELCKKPLSVVFLENVDKADVQAQNCLSRAIQTGKFSDSHGREVGINNAIFVSTSTFPDNEIMTSREESCCYLEERIVRTKGGPMQLFVEQAPANKWGQKGICSSMFVNKRKLDGANHNLEEHDNSEMAKRAHKTSARILDLNLPADENDAQGSEDGNSDNDSISGNSKAWLQDFFDQLDRTVVFKPVDFNALAATMLGEIHKNFNNIIGPECSLDIDQKVVEQLLAAAYLSNGERVVENWVEEVLSKGFTEVSKRYTLNAHSIVKLVTCKGIFSEEQMPLPGAHLPSKIILN